MLRVVPPAALFSLRLVSGGAEEAGMKGWRERAADMLQKRGGDAAK